MGKILSKIMSSLKVPLGVVTSKEILPNPIGQSAYKAENKINCNSSALESRYNLVTSPKDLRIGLDKIGEELKKIHKKMNQAPKDYPHSNIETGWLSTNGRYIYLKSFGILGWLVEEAKNGCIISRGEKISDKELFCRKGEIWDTTELYTTDSLPFPRICSKRTSMKIVSITIYGNILEKAILDEYH